MKKQYPGKNTGVNQSNKMCGIFGSTKFKLYEKLYSYNITRGTFAGGSLYVKPCRDLYIKKWQGKQYVNELTGFYAWAHEYKLFMGHTQAPTGAQREFTKQTTHPFETNNWIVAHNGVLENNKQLEAELLQHLDNPIPPVDSAIIPALLDDVYVGDDVQAIEQVCGMLKGTFACWIYSKMGKQAYLVRSGCTLLGNIETSSFSSIYVPRVAESLLDEGVIYCVTDEGLTTVGTFEQSSPFYIL